MSSYLPSFRRFSRGGTAVAVLLVTALALVVWLGYEGIDAAASQRRTAEAVLRDYALVSATQLAREARSELDDVVDEILVPVLRRERTRRGVSPGAIARELDDGRHPRRRASPQARARPLRAIC